MDRDETKPGSGRYSEAWWRFVAKDMAAYQAEQEELWGGIDEMTAVRYVAGECTQEEKARVEQAMRDHPELRKSIEISQILQSVLPTDPAVSDPTSTAPLDDVDDDEFDGEADALSEDETTDEETTDGERTDDERTDA